MQVDRYLILEFYTQSPRQFLCCQEIYANNAGEMVYNTIFKPFETV